MIIKQQDETFELQVMEQLPLDSPGAGDTCFLVRVQVGNFEAVFSARATVWVAASALADFANQLRSLEKRRKGAAVMESMSPGQLRLEVRIYDPAGHIGAFGHLGKWCLAAAGGRYWSALTFEIPFCPTELPTLVREFERLANPTTIAR